MTSAQRPQRPNAWLITDAVIHVLLVEDNHGDLRLIREMLLSSEGARFKLDAVATLSDALMALEAKQPDAILLDLSLPDSYGIDTLHHVHEHSSQVPIVVLTGSDDINLGVQAVQMGAQDYLIKGEADGKLLTRAIRYAIERLRIDIELRQTERELAALEERQRLARELHDSVSQTLFTCRTIGEASLRQWDINPLRARELMEQAHELTTLALAEMRVLLLELRPTALTILGFKQLLEQFLLPMQGRQNFELDLVVDDVPMLPPEVQIALYRIVQETLNNVIKHASATNVAITVRDLPDRIDMSIADDGEGFDSLTLDPTSFGLGIMRERAEGIGASLAISTRLGEGTQVQVVWKKRAT
ncbi:MAG: response regulator [Chloroflexota bacterium]|nr:response regulator [Chloroflexota bacterium]